MLVEQTTAVSPDRLAESVGRERRALLKALDAVEAKAQAYSDAGAKPRWRRPPKPATAGRS